LTIPRAAVERTTKDLVGTVGTVVASQAGIPSTVRMFWIILTRMLRQTKTSRGRGG
jgi:hypothetical protein